MTQESVTENGSQNTTPGEIGQRLLSNGDLTFIETLDDFCIASNESGRFFNIKTLRGNLAIMADEVFVQVQFLEGSITLAGSKCVLGLVNEENSCGKVQNHGSGNTIFTKDGLDRVGMYTATESLSAQALDEEWFVSARANNPYRLEYEIKEPTGTPLQEDIAPQLKDTHFFENASNDGDAPENPPKNLLDPSKIKEASEGIPEIALGKIIGFAADTPNETHHSTFFFGGTPTVPEADSSKSQATTAPQSESKNIFASEAQLPPNNIDGRPSTGNPRSKSPMEGSPGGSRRKIISLQEAREARYRSREPKVQVLDSTLLQALDQLMTPVRPQNPPPGNAENAQASATETSMQTVGEPIEEQLTESAVFGTWNKVTENEPINSAHAVQMAGTAGRIDFTRSPTSYTYQI